MRLSDAIATGRVLIKDLKPATLKGCVIGMACMGVGTEALLKAVQIESYYEIYHYWPWLRNATLSPVDDGVHDGMEVIYSIFDFHVMRKGDWTLDQLIDWVRSIEPDEREVINISVVSPNLKEEAIR
jgi:hypothetical protein